MLGTRNKNLLPVCRFKMTVQLRNREMSEMTLNLVPAHDEVLVMDLSHGSDTSHSQREKKFPSSVVVVRVENVSLNR